MAELLESTIKTKIVKYINNRALGAIQIRHQAGYNIKGDPDLTGHYRKMHCEIEVKRPGMKPTPKQLIRLEYWHNSGAQVAVLRSEDGARKFIGMIDAKFDNGTILEGPGIFYDDVVKRTKH